MLINTAISTQSKERLNRLLQTPTVKKMAQATMTDLLARRAKTAKENEARMSAAERKVLLESKNGDTTYWCKSDTKVTTLTHALKTVVVAVLHRACRKNPAQDREDIGNHFLIDTRAESHEIDEVNQLLAVTYAMMQAESTSKHPLSALFGTYAEIIRTEPWVNHFPYSSSLENAKIEYVPAFQTIICSTKPIPSGGGERPIIIRGQWPTTEDLSHVVFNSFRCPVLEQPKLLQRLELTLGA